MKYKSRVNFIIDVIMFIVMMAIGGIGFLMKFVLVSGSKGWEIYGEKVDLLLWGWDRHQWGALHLILGYVLGGLLVLHIILHWKQITCLFRGLIAKRSVRVALTFLFVLVCAVLLLFAFIVDFEVIIPKSGEGGHRATHGRTKVEHASDSSAVQDRGQEGEGHEEDAIEVYGSMTLKDVERAYHMPADSVKKYLGIPFSVSESERLGRLKRRYPFHMSDVSRLIQQYHE